MIARLLQALASAAVGALVDVLDKRLNTEPPAKGPYVPPPPPRSKRKSG